MHYKYTKTVFKHDLGGSQTSVQILQRKRPEGHRLFYTQLYRYLYLMYVSNDRGKTLLSVIIPACWQAVLVFFASLCVSVCLSSLSEGLDIIRCICFYCRVCACIHLCVCERETESEKWRLCLDFSVNFIFYQSVFMQTVMLSRMWAAIQRLGRCLLMN